MLKQSSFAFHARQTPDRCVLKYCGEETSYAAFKVLKRLLRADLEPNA